MSLVQYRKKRNFSRTAEPRGAVGRKHEQGLQYVIQKHAASRLHYDFRLELDGTLKSWAVPKGPSLDPGRKVLAVQVEDHPLEYGGFEGVIPKGEYGGGTVLLWDNGTWEPLEDPHEGMKNGKLRFALHGKKLQGEWSLVRMHGAAGENGKNWLLMKRRDEFSREGGGDILEEAPESVKSRRSLEQIGEARDDVWSRDAAGAARMTGAKKGGMPEKLSPQLAVLAEHPPAGEEWIHEIKFDGYRLLAFVKGGAVTLRTRTGADWTARFAALEPAFAKLKVDSAIIDGEVVALGADGQSDFQALQGAMKAKGKTPLRYFAFDLPFYNGVDLRGTPLLERKEMLKKLLDQSGSAGGKGAELIAYSDHVRGSGEEVIEKACALGTEGIVSKRADAPYVSRRDPSWQKCKCTLRQEFVIIGYTESTKRSEGLRSLLLGYHAPGKGLVYSGRVGTGFDSRMLKDLYRRLLGLGQVKPPGGAPLRERRAGHWVSPKLVCEVRFTGWTRDGVLRHPVFEGLREDKRAEEVKREVPMERASRRDEKSDEAEEKPGTSTAPPPGPPAKGEAKKKHDSGAGKGQFAGVVLTHPERVLYPDQGITKRDLAAYYEGVAELLLPHVVERPLALVRCPDGLAAKGFFMRNWSETLPKPVDKISVGEGEGGGENHVLIHDLAGLMGLVQISALEIHTWNCMGEDLEHPDQLVFDLDPGPDLPWRQVVNAARIMKQTLAGLKLPVFLKTSGGKGLHLTVPIKPTIGWAQAKAFCKTIATFQASQGELFIANMRKDLRRGKVYIDYLRNGRGATAVAPYSTRARVGAAVSMPIFWEQLGEVGSADQFTVKNALAYLENRKRDPWRDFAGSRTDLGKVVPGKSLPQKE